VITFDEGVPGDNQIYTLLVGPMIPEGNIDNTRYTHYSLLRLIEENFGLGSLNRGDSSAELITTKHFMRGTIHFYDGTLVLVLSVGLPLVAVVILGVVVYTFYRRRVRIQRRRMGMTPAELNVLLADVGGDDV